MMFFSHSIEAGEIIQLPHANLAGAMSLEESIAKRRSIRAFSSQPLSIAQLGQLLWAAQGITSNDQGLRTAPSAGALYPLETYAIMGDGIYRYNPLRHELRRIVEGDKRLALQTAALGQEAIASAPVVLMFTAVLQRTAAKYGDRASRYVHMEAGHACQNVLLQATALGLAGVPIGAFDDRRVAEVVKLPKNESPLYLVPVGHR